MQTQANHAARLQALQQRWAACGHNVSEQENPTDYWAVQHLGHAANDQGHLPGIDFPLEVVLAQNEMILLALEEQQQQRETTQSQQSAQQSA